MFYNKFSTRQKSPKMEYTWENYTNKEYDVNLNIKVENDDTYNEMDLFDVEEHDLIIPDFFKIEVDVKREMDNVLCFKCHASFPNSYELARHDVKHLRVQIPKLNILMCDHCPFYHENKNDLIIHIHTNHATLFTNNISKSLLQCKICGKYYQYKHFASHMKDVHSERKIKCNQCKNTFKNVTYLKRHMKYVHTGLKPSWRSRIKGNNIEVDCPICFKTLANKHALKTHNRNCHSEKVECPQCKSILKCKTYLFAHMRRVHYDDGKKHGCDICDKTFKSPRYLRVHKKNTHDRKKDL